MMSVVLLRSALSEMPPLSAACNEKLCYLWVHLNFIRYIPYSMWYATHTPARLKHLPVHNFKEIQIALKAEVYFKVDSRWFIL